jgi:hypothetical protein
MYRLKEGAYLKGRLLENVIDANARHGELVMATMIEISNLKNQN